MKYIVQHPTHGSIEYDESFWSGKRSLTVNGTQLTAINKKTFEYGASKIDVKGNFLTGVTLTLEGETIQIIPKPTWYEMVFTVLMFCVGIVWGNFPALVAFFPIVGGAIGGFLCALFAMTNLCVTRLTQKSWLKLLICVGFLGITILVCHWVALALLTALA